MRALVVEDSSTIRMILSRFLQKMNFEVSEATNGLLGLERLKEISTPDVMLVDWNMPIMSGIEFIRAVRNLRIYDLVPLIMVTTNSEEEYLSVALDAGANEYIQKPCTFDALCEKLNQMGILIK